MANPRGRRGEAWTDVEVERLEAYMVLLEQGSVSQGAIAQAMGRSISSIEGKIRGIRETRSMGATLGPGLARYEKPVEIPSDDQAHVERVLSARPQGFAVAFSRPHFRVPA